MQRREFLKSSMAVAGLGTILPDTQAAAEETGKNSGREVYELRHYQMRRGPQTGMFDRFYREAAIPALNRAGVERVGVFNVSIGPASPAVYVLLTHSSVESALTVTDRLLADPEYLQAGAPFLDAPATAPAYERVESSLMSAFAAMPKLDAPDFGADHKSRLFELRTYESHSKKANKKKIEMFAHGEIAIFRHNGMQPVFFGETLIGSRLPNLTYMLAFKNPQEREANWLSFANDPEWEKLRTTPGYGDADIVCNITNFILRPAPYSQI